MTLHRDNRRQQRERWVVEKSAPHFLVNNALLNNAGFGVIGAFQQTLTRW